MLGSCSVLSSRKTEKEDSKPFFLLPYVAIEAGERDVFWLSCDL